MGHPNLFASKPPKIMFRYLPGIVLVQLVTLALFWVNRAASVQDLLLRAGLPALIIAVVTALWLSTLSRMEAERHSAQLREEHADEREKLKRKIERTRSEVLQQASADKAQMQERAHVERERLVEQTHHQLMQRERSISRRANIKVGLAFMAVSGLGVLMLITELLTLGLLTITTAGGALGGYLLRWRQSRRALDRLSGALDPSQQSASATETSTTGTIHTASGDRADSSDHDVAVVTGTATGMKGNRRAGREPRLIEGQVLGSDVKKR